MKIVYLKRSELYIYIHIMGVYLLGMQPLANALDHGRRTADDKSLYGLWKRTGHDDRVLWQMDTTRL